MSLDGFYGCLAALAGDPDLVRRCRAGDQDWMLDFDVEPVERHRLNVMARDNGMEVLCSLYRSNRLAALIRTVPALVEALGADLRSEVSAFWISTPRSDMQFRSEGAAFCAFVRGRHRKDCSLMEAVATAERGILERYDRE